MHTTLGVLIIILSLFMITMNVCFGQESDWSTYKEPKGRFMLKYPNTWLLGEDFNVSNSNGLKFYIDGAHRSQLNELLQIGIGHRDASLSAPSMNLTTSLRLDSVLFTEKFKNDFQNFSLLREPNYNKYRLDGQDSLSFPFSFVKFNLPMKGLFVATDFEGSIFYILYMADQKDYSITLPIIEKIIRSINIQNI
jgi:hypothetical protein